MAFTYILPFVFYAILSPHALSGRWKAWATANVLIGLIVMVAGLASSVNELFGCEGGWFAGECRLAYTYAPDAPNDPCSESGLPFGVT